MQCTIRLRDAHHVRMVFATVILGSYREDERVDLAQMIRQVTGRDDGLSEFGIYCFWDTQSREILYLGLASNIRTRFRQHNWLLGKRADGNKRVEIAAWFEEREVLGYSLVTQSAAVRILENFGLDTRKGIIGRGEGQLIEAHRQARGSIPIWNKIGGSKRGAQDAKLITSGWMDLLTGSVESLFISRRTLRELADSEDDYQREMTLHGARLNAMMQGGLSRKGVGDAEIQEWLGRLLQEPRWGGDAEALIDLATSGYLLLDQPRVVASGEVASSD